MGLLLPFIWNLSPVPLGGAGVAALIWFVNLDQGNQSSYTICHKNLLKEKTMTSTHIYSEVFKTSEFAEVFLQFAINVQVFGFGIF